MKNWLFLWTALSLSTVARANLSAPIELGTFGSTALSALVTDQRHLEVRGETLRIRCESSTCAIFAEYRVEAQAPVSLELEFLYPTPSPVAVMVSGELLKPPKIRQMPSNTQDAKTLAETTRSSCVRKRNCTVHPIFAARFMAALKKGENAIVVTYTQPLAFRGRPVYFSDPGVGYEFSYYLWPLKSWKLSPTFSLDLQIDWIQPRRGWLARVLGLKKRRIGCEGFEQREIAPQKLAGLKAQEEAVSYRTTLAGSFPDILHCWADASIDYESSGAKDLSEFADLHEKRMNTFPALYQTITAPREELTSDED